MTRSEIFPIENLLLRRQEVFAFTVKSTSCALADDVWKGKTKFEQCWVRKIFIITVTTSLSCVPTSSHRDNTWFLILFLVDDQVVDVSHVMVEAHVVFLSPCVDSSLPIHQHIEQPAQFSSRDQIYCFFDARRSFLRFMFLIDFPYNVCDARPPNDIFSRGLFYVFCINISQQFKTRGGTGRRQTGENYERNESLSGRER